MAWYNWSQTASNNAGADPNINWAEGMAPSAVNDSARAMMAQTAKWRDDISGATVTAGSSTAYTVASNSVFDTLAHMSGQIIAFSPHVTNGATVLLNVDGLGQKPLRSAPNVELLAGTIIQGTPYVAVYNNTDAVFYLQGFFGNPYNIPLGAGMDYWLGTAPNSSFVFPIGQAISRTTYATLFSAMGTTYGTGDGSTTFNLPDKTGRVSAMIEAAGESRLTPTYFGGASNTLGAVGGGESETLSIANINTFTPTGTISGTTEVNGGSTNVTGGSGLPIYFPSGGGLSSLPFVGTLSMNSLGSGTPHRTVQPTICCNYILRII